MIIDSGLKGDDYVSFVATDNEVGGRLGGEKLAALLGGRGRVILLRYAEGSDSTTKREEGFLTAMRANPGIEVVSSNRVRRRGRGEGAYKKGERRFSASTSAPTGAWRSTGSSAPTEPATFGMLRVLQDNGWARKVKFVGFDASEILVKSLGDGLIDGLVVQDPMNIGYSASGGRRAHQGRAVERRVDTGVRVVSRADMETPEAKALLKPDLDQMARLEWLKNK